jgi:hypothetical protein
MRPDISAAASRSVLVLPAPAAASMTTLSPERNASIAACCSAVGL